MRVLLDEQLPRRLGRSLIGHDARTVQQGWAGVRNGDLLRRAADAGFEIFLTADQSLPFQLMLTAEDCAAIAARLINSLDYAEDDDGESTA